MNKYQLPKIILPVFLILYLGSCGVGDIVQTNKSRAVVDNLTLGETLEEILLKLQPLKKIKNDEIYELDGKQIRVVFVRTEMVNGVSSPTGRIDGLLRTNGLAPLVFENNRFIGKDEEYRSLRYNSRALNPAQVKAKEERQAVAEANRAAGKLLSIDACGVAPKYGAINPYIYFTNNSGKRIKYINFNVAFYNAVNDPAPCSITGKSRCTLKVVGPIEHGERYINGWERAIYSKVCSSMQITSINIEYMDGATKNLIKSEVDRLGAASGWNSFKEN